MRQTLAVVNGGKCNKWLILRFLGVVRKLHHTLRGGKGVEEFMTLRTTPYAKRGLVTIETDSIAQTLICTGVKPVGGEVYLEL